MNGVFIIPTGLGCAIGGDAGDAVCSVNLIASMCDRLIVNPNAVNASDINEMAGNCLYVEGSILDRFLAGELGLKESRRNDILLAVNAPASPHTVNSANAARVALGVEIEIVELKEPLILKGWLEDDGTAGGLSTGVSALLQQVRRHEYDALAVQTPIDVENPVVEWYLKHGGVNPWGGIEARVSRALARELLKPVAHAPLERDDGYFKDYLGVTDARLSAEMVSVSYIHSILKGLARAPVIGDGLNADDFDFLVTPDGCFGPPHRACLERGIEVIVVEDNPTVLDRRFPRECTRVRNYLECAGYLACKRIGIGAEYVLSGDLGSAGSAGPE